MSQFLKLVPFSGMLPKVAERLLPDGASVSATNLVLSSGEIKPIKKPLLVNTPGGSGPWYSVYRPEWNGADKWLAWTKDVDIARAPLSSDVEPRYYWTGDNEPRFSTFSNLPATFFSLGIPRPQAAPGVSHSGGTGTAVSRAYVYTFFSTLGEESAPSPANVLVTGKVDGTWAIASMDAFPVSSGTVTGAHASGVTTFNNTTNHWLRAGEEVTIAGTKMLVVSAPSATTFTVAGNYAAATTWARVAPWNTTGMKRRLYRSAGTVATYQLVNDNVGTTYSDTLTDLQIMGDALISTAWVLPPVDLEGLIALPSGAMVGFAGNQLCYSEPYQPHAWPLVYRNGTDFEIIGIAAYGSVVVAATAGKPYVSNGIEPASATMDAIDQIWPCQSKRSVVSVGDGVMYATINGMAYIGSSGQSIWTVNLYTKLEWAPLSPSSMVAAMAEDKVFVRWFGADGTKGVLVFHPAEPSLGVLSLSAIPDELYTDPRNGHLYLVDASGIYQFDAQAGSRVMYSWKSKEYYLPQPVNFGAAKIDFVSEMKQVDYDAIIAAYNAAIASNALLVTGYRGAGGLNGSSINNLAQNSSNIVNVSLPSTAATTFSMYCDGVLVHSRALVAGDGKFRLPGGYKASTIQIELNGTNRIKGVRIAETMSALRAVP